MYNFRYSIIAMVFMALVCTHAAEVTKTEVDKAAAPDAEEPKAMEKKTLINYNPFLPKGWAPPKPKVRPVKPPPPPQLWLHGIMKINGVRQFSLYDKRSNKRVWVSLGENVKLNPNSPTASFVVTKYDETENVGECASNNIYTPGRIESA